jgi:hypothetical protein
MLLRHKYNPLSQTLFCEAILTQSESLENDLRNRKYFVFHATFFRKLMAAALPEDMRGVYAEIPKGFGD